MVNHLPVPICTLPKTYRYACARQKRVEDRQCTIYVLLRSSCTGSKGAERMRLTGHGFTVSVRVAGLFDIHTSLEEYESNPPEPRTFAYSMQSVMLRML